MYVSCPPNVNLETSLVKSQCNPSISVHLPLLYSLFLYVCTVYKGHGSQLRSGLALLKSRHRACRPPSHLIIAHRQMDTSWGNYAASVRGLPNPLWAVFALVKVAERERERERAHAVSKGYGYMCTAAAKQKCKQNLANFLYWRRI